MKAEPVGARKVHAFAILRKRPRYSVELEVAELGDKAAIECDIRAEWYMDHVVVRAWFDDASIPDADVSHNESEAGCLLVRSPYVRPSDRYARQAIRRGWTRISPVPEP